MTLNNKIVDFIITIMDNFFEMLQKDTDFIFNTLLKICDSFVYRVLAVLISFVGFIAILYGITYGNFTTNKLIFFGLIVYFSIIFLNIRLYSLFVQSVILKLILRIKETQLKRLKKTEMNYSIALTMEYFNNYLNKAFFGCFIVSVSVLLFAIILQDISILSILVIYVVLNFVFIRTTYYRIKYGYFCDNSSETLELIEFILSQASQGKPPHSKNVSMSLAGRVEARIIDIEKNRVSGGGIA